MWASLPILLLILAQAGRAQNANPTENFQFDPDATVTDWCNLPPFQDTTNYFKPQLGMCEEPDPTLTLADASALAVQFAPYLYFHPLEKYTLTDMDLALEPNSGKIYYSGSSPPTVFSEQIDQTAMLNSTRDPNLGLASHKYFFSHADSVGGQEQLYAHEYLNEPPPGYLKGSGYDEQGLTNAPIYFNVFDSGNNTWTFNFFFYYAFNGHSNLGVLSSHNGTEVYTPFQLRPVGQHEGDFEGMSIMVCKSTVASQPLAVTYRQHSWSEVTNCLEGNCHFFKDTFNAVGFAALNSHATYPVPTRNMIYANVQVPFFVNLQGVLVLDRTEFKDANGNIKQFLPNAANVLELQNPASIELGVTPEADYWQAWGGAFGDITTPNIDKEVYCLALDQQSYVECPTVDEDPVFYLVMQTLGVYPVNNTEENNLIIQASGQIGNSVGSTFEETGKAPQGPQTKSYLFKWTAPKNAPIWKSISNTTNETEYCQRLTEIPDTSRTSTSVSTFDVYGNIIGILAVSVIVPIAVAVWYIWPRMRGGMFKSIIAFDESGNVLEPDRAALWKVFRPALLFTAVFAVGIAGIVMFGGRLGFGDLFQLLDDIVGGDVFDLVVNLVVILGIIVIVLDVIFLIFIWVTTFSLWKNVWIVYYKLSGDEENLEKEKASRFGKHFLKLHTVFVIFFSLMFLSLMITAVCVVVGIGVVGFSYGFTEVCNTTVGSLDGFCLDLNFLGIEKIACGADFQEFCREWGKTARANAIWGAFMMLWANFFFIAAGGEAYNAQVTIYPWLLGSQASPESRSLVSKSAAPAKEEEEAASAEQAVQDNVKMSEDDSGVQTAVKEDDGGDYLS